ncbi:MAG TPA: aminotransferase class V-fold PLP-dependent enzyme, partial [Vicinamibacterales bacterium]|nr:aminotransferase class V-fold PLP-dependent enzyme [Vicinamibacterales bacterium]
MSTTTAASVLDVRAVRADFPALAQDVHGRPLVYLDNAATTQKPRPVLETLRHYYERDNANVHRGVHALSERATESYEGAREKVRAFVNAASVHEIVFTRYATEGINLVARAWGDANVGAGDEVLITAMEHHSNIVPWQQLCGRTGATLKVAPIDDRGDVVLDEYARLLSDRTKMVAFVHLSNALGTVNPAAEMVALARRAGAAVLVDGSQAAYHMATDVRADFPALAQDVHGR